MAKAIIEGTVKRIAKLLYPDRTQVTVHTNKTIIDNHEFTLGEKVTFEVGMFGISCCPFKAALYNLAPGDEVKVEFDMVNGKWEVVNMENTPDIGRQVEDWFDDLSKDLEYWRKKGSIKD